MLGSDESRKAADRRRFPERANEGCYRNPKKRKVKEPKQIYTRIRRILAFPEFEFITLPIIYNKPCAQNQAT